MKGMAAVSLLVLLANPVWLAAVARDKAAYVGGTIARFNRSGTAIKGRVEICAHHFVFVPENSPLAAERLRIDYESIRHLEFGQRTSRRAPLVVGAAVPSRSARPHVAVGKEPCTLPHDDLRG